MDENRQKKEFLHLRWALRINPSHQKEKKKNEESLQDLQNTIKQTNIPEGKEKGKAMENLFHEIDKNFPDLHRETQRDRLPDLRSSKDPT